MLIMTVCVVVKQRVVRRMVVALLARARQAARRIAPHLISSQDLQVKVNSLNDATEFHDPQTASSSGLSHVPSQSMSIPSTRGMISRDSCLQPDTRNSLGTSGVI